MLLKQILTAVRMLAVMTLLTGVIYPLLVTGFAWTIFPWQAQGSLIEVNGQVTGSALIGQNFDQPQYFWGRPSATGYSALPSGGSNLAPSSQQLADAVAGRAAALRSAHNLGAADLLPADLLFASGSGLDGHISLAAAELQIGRVAAARGIPVERVRELVLVHTESPQWLLFGQERVNVLLLNLALDGIESSYVR